MTAAKEDFSENTVKIEEVQQEPSLSTRIGGFIGRHLFAFTFLGGALVGSGYTKIKMNRQFNFKLRTYESMVKSITGVDTKFF